MSSRDHDFEDAFLSEAEFKAHMDHGWSGRVRSRIAFKDHELGDAAFMRIELDRFIVEMRDEAEDLGGWPALFLERLRAEGRWTDEQLDMVRDLALSYASLGPIADELARQMARTLDLDEGR